MAIKRKNGNIYRLQGPNPIMKKQSFWDDNSIVHNFNPPEIITKLEVALENIEPEVIHVPVKETKIPNVTKSIPKVVKIKVHVLPAVIQESYDQLYDEKRNSIGYGQKFTIEVVVASQNDLSTTLWTNGKEISRGSIIYVPKDCRWWRVQEVSTRDGGYLVICSPSDLQPSFEETDDKV